MIFKTLRSETREDHHDNEYSREKKAKKQVLALQQKEASGKRRSRSARIIELATAFSNT